MDANPAPVKAVSSSPSVEKKSSNTGETKRAQEHINKIMASPGGIASIVQLQHNLRLLLTHLLSLGVMAVPLRLSWAANIVRSNQVEFALQVLFVLLLSSNTTDSQAISGGMALVNDPRFSLLWILTASSGVIESIIFSAGRQVMNTQYMKECAAMILSEFNGRVPAVYELLMKLPGVGSKIAALVMMTCFGICPVSTRSSFLFLLSNVSPANNTLRAAVFLSSSNPRVLLWTST
jgi:endonuclease III